MSPAAEQGAPTTGAPTAMAVTWRYPKRARRLAHAVELGPFTRPGRQAEDERCLPAALCGSRPTRGWMSWSLYLGEDEDRRCAKCGPLFDRWHK